jgi:hypothetical protein
MIALVLLPAISNVEANALPDTWAPFLWVAWPIGLLLAAPLIYLEVRQRQQNRQPTQEHGVPAEDNRRRLDRAATDLAKAVHRQWTNEARLRSVRRPQPLRVRWSSTQRPVAANLVDVTAPDVVPRRPLAIRGNTAAEMANVLSKTQDRQLVILGEPGAGKTVLALLFVLHLLEHRRPDEPIPVLLTVSSWNPRTEHLRTWLARRVLEEYPALGNEQEYGVDTAATLVADGRILAVLDGLDEMPAGARPVALDAIDRAAATEYPLVITCRSTEYETAVAGSGTFLRRAAVLEIQPVDLADAGRFLAVADPTAANRWRAVLDELRGRPGTPLARVLANPLMVSLARTVYTVPTSAPAELLDSVRFSKQAQIERHLLDGFIPAVYRHTPATPGAAPVSGQEPYLPKQVAAWLAFLARHLNHLDPSELAWWRLVDAIPRATRALCVGLPIGLLFGVSGAVAGGVLPGLIYALVLGLAAALVSAFGWPSRSARVQLRFHGTAKPCIGGFAAGAAVGLGLALALRQPVFPAAVSGLVFGVAFASRIWLDIPTDAAEAPNPRVALRQNRTAALTLGLAVAVAFGLVSGAGFTVSTRLSLDTPNGFTHLLISALGSAAAGGFAGYIGYRWVGAAAFSGAGAVVGGLTFGPAHGLISGDNAGLAYGIVFGLAAGMVGVLSRAWGGFVVSRIWLGLHGHLPWRLMRFLDDAHRRGVLRQSGAVYEFRHAKLQGHLADTNHESQPLKRRPVL